MENILDNQSIQNEVENLQPDGTDLGTFKSVKTLKDAYDSLRKSFTQKTMELAKLKKEQLDNSENQLSNLDNKSSEKVDKNAKNTQKSDVFDEKTRKNSDLNDFKEEINSLNEDSIEEKIESDKAEKTPDNTADKVNSPAQIWERENWNDDVRNFFTENEKAKSYVKEIGQVLVQDKIVANSQNPLQMAWLKVLEKKFTENIVNDEDLEQIVLKNDALKQKIIQQYLNELKSKKSAPAVISKAQGAEINAKSSSHALSMAEAKELAKKILIK